MTSNFNLRRLFLLGRTSHSLPFYRCLNLHYLHFFGRKNSQLKIYDLEKNDISVYLALLDNYKERIPLKA